MRGNRQNRASRHAAALFVAMLGASGCVELSSETYQFSLTVEIDTPDGVHSGSGVYEVWARNKTALLSDEAKRDWGVRGQAVAVDLSNGRTVFALLSTQAKHGDLAGLSMTALDPMFGNDMVASARRISSGQGVSHPVEISRDDYPIFVTFRDIDNPASVERINADDLAASFGTGYTIRRVVVHTTDDPVTTGIEQRFEWWGNYEDRQFDGQRYNNSTAFANSLNRLHFRRGNQK